MIKTILWDFDGVIAESVNVKTEAFYEMYLPYGKEIANQVVEYHLAHGGVSRFEKFTYWHENYLQKKLLPVELHNLANEFSNLVLQKVVDAPYIPGVIEFIKNSQEKYRHYIISGTPDEELKIIVNRRKIQSLFKRVMGSPVTKSKWIHNLIEEGMIEIENSLFVGDAKADFSAATETGVKFILREVDYNKDIFSSYTGMRVKDFYGFASIVEGL